MQSIQELPTSDEEKNSDFILKDRDLTPEQASSSVL
jgi:hypothetical protein